MKKQNKSNLAIPAFKAIFFDWGGVFTAPRQITSSTKKLEKLLKVPQGSLTRLLYDNNYWDKALIGEISDQEFWQKTLAQFGIHDTDGVNEFKGILFQGEKDHLRKGMINLVSHLRKHYLIALLSNADDVFRPLLRTKFHVDDIFNLIIISAEEGIAKPDCKIFLNACQKLNVQPTECIFIDDSLKNIQAARSIGIYSIQYLNSGGKTSSLKKELRNIGVQI